MEPSVTAIAHSGQGDARGELPLRGAGDQHRLPGGQDLGGNGLGGEPLQGDLLSAPYQVPPGPEVMEKYSGFQLLLEEDTGISLHTDQGGLPLMEASFSRSPVRSVTSR